MASCDAPRSKAPPLPEMRGEGPRIFVYQFVNLVVKVDIHQLIYEHIRRFGGRSPQSKFWVGTQVGEGGVIVPSDTMGDVGGAFVSVVQTRTEANMERKVRLFSVHPAWYGGWRTNYGKSGRCGRSTGDARRGELHTQLAATRWQKPLNFCPGTFLAVPKE
jgi:hypothetical protein